ncbi:MAG: hypothetical protein Q9160_001915 [Pyrenula sp. 1 TL-2023]
MPSSPSPSSSSIPSHLHSLHTQNLHTLLSRPLSETSGSLGDLGTFLPILVAQTLSSQISLPTTLIFSGLWNILTGALFGIPLPVQPMKAIAAVALLKGLSAGEVAAAGVFVAGCVGVLAATGLLGWFGAWVPVPVVKGIQVGAALSLVVSAGGRVLGELGWGGPSWADSFVWVVVAFLGLMVVNVYPRVPYALVVFGLGLVFALVRTFGKEGEGEERPGFEVWRPYGQVPTGREWRVGIVDAGIGQLPLTTLNSIVAVVHLAADLLPNTPTPSMTAIGFSVAGMNLVGCWFGAMPVCHGSGGLAAQYKFGARSGASIIFLGTCKLIIGLVFGQSLTGVLKKFPTALLGMLVIAAGLELASVGESLNTNRARDVGKSQGLPDDTAQEQMDEGERKRRWSVMLVTIGGILAFKNDAVGFLAGMVCHWSYQIPSLYERHRPTFGRGRIRLSSSSEHESP